MRRHVGVGNWAKLVSFVAVAAIIAASCGSDKKTSTSVAPGSTQPGATSGTTAAAPAGTARELVIARDMDLTTLDLSLTYCDTCQIFNTAVYETLITVDPADPNKILPRLATSWEANTDNTVFTFKLDPTAKFDDGSAVEAKDVKFSWERLQNMKGSASYLMSGLKSIDTPDAGTVIATFSAPNSAFLPIVAASYLGIINSDVATAQGASAAADAATADKAGDWFLGHSAGSGPYKLESYTQGDKLVLARNDQYWGAKKPVFPKVTIAEVKDSSSQLQQLQSGDADIAMQISLDSVAQLQGDTKINTSVVDSYNYVYIALSPGAVGGEKLKDPNVRKAIIKAIDYDGAIQSLVAGKGKKQASPIPNGFLGAADLTLPSYDLEGAKKLLADAGLADGFDLDATYPDANVYGVDFNLMMQKLQQDLVKVKINLQLTPIQFPEWVTRINEKGIPVTAVYFAPDHTDSSQYIQYFGEIPDSSWAARAGGGKAGAPLDNPKETELLATALASSGDAKAKAYTDLGQQMIDDAIIVPIVNPQLVLASAADITGMHYSACCNLDLGLLGLKG
ncbi:MAG: peptide/nickel transport system substrate-binding protein [Ilumatobacteraceae bacterium]|nr:peptide/nickel transport system substrate-binding protein [Ilumatobacteraceae bacterium]